MSQVNELPCVVIGCCEDRSTRCVLRGAAGELGLEFRTVPDLNEALQTLKAVPAAVLVVERTTSSEDLIDFLQETRRSPRVSTIVILEALDEATESRVLRSGAAVCLGAQVTARDFLPQLESIAATASSGAEHCIDNHLDSRQILLVSDKVTLSLPGFWLANGEHGAHLPRIPGALLACLAARPNQVVTSKELIRTAWGTEDGVTPDALYQQVHQLRSRLLEFGVSERLKAVHGHGYMLQREIRS